MYSWVLRRLPGPPWLRALQALVLVGLAVVALMTWVFPWISEFLPWTDSTVEGPATSAP